MYDALLQIDYGRNWSRKLRRGSAPVNILVYHLTSVTSWGKAVGIDVAIG